ncbi:hypothetical protein ASE66_17185 [Bosea sp. Root483D1]|uniref:hypothetical protein n=1 Tax=Bosea sp. Root483D1 TaxID=1736544 RepID=UPI00070C18B7|nr:hypothetical protein [Bosea sp. Root483D1]KRE12295.1 hypothetical protein ASE66_17185 [Bosea sp. Root483D1]
MKRLSIAAAVMLGAALLTPALTSGAEAGEAVPASLAAKLDELPAAFTMTDAKRRRLMMMQDATRQQRWHDRRRGNSYGYGHPGYGRPHGPPPRHGYYRRNDRW